MQVLLDGKKFFSLVLIKKKLGCNLNPRRGSFSVPVTNFSILLRLTLPLLPPVMNIKISVHNDFTNLGTIKVGLSCLRKFLPN